MSILTVALVLIVVGILLWAVNTYVPMDPKIKQILNVVVILMVVVWLLGVFGLFDALRGVKVGKVG
jgi:heme A synthase